MSRYVGEGVTRGPLPLILSGALAGLLYWVGLDQWVKAVDAGLADFGGEEE